MRTSSREHDPPRAVRVSVGAGELSVALADGRTVTAPLAWYPRLADGAPAELANWRLVGGGEGIHWPDLDEDVSVANLLGGARSGESPRSFARWRTARRG